MGQAITSNTPTCPNMIRLEPALRHLDHMARTATSWSGWDLLHRKLQRVAGPNARLPSMRSTMAYRVCHGHLLKVWEANGRADQVHVLGLDEFNDPRHTASDHRLDRRDYQRRDRRRRREAIA